MLRGILGKMHRGWRTSRERPARKPRLELLENRRLMYGANALSWVSTASNELPADAAALNILRDSIDTGAVQVGERIPRSAATVDSAAAEVRLLRRQFLAADRNTVMGETLCVAAQAIESDSSRLAPAPLPVTPTTAVTPSPRNTTGHSGIVLGVTEAAGARLSHPSSVQIASIEDRGAAAAPTSVLGKASSESPLGGTATVRSEADLSITGTSHFRNTQGASNQVVIITLKKRVPLAPVGTGGTSGTGGGTNGTPTTPGSPNSGANSPVARIPNVLDLPGTSVPVSGGSGSTNNGNPSQPADPPPPRTGSTIGLSRQFLSAAGARPADSNSTGSGQTGTNTGGSPTTTGTAVARTFLTSTGRSTSGGSPSSSTNWPQLVDSVMTGRQWL